jgi:hypothetical protein
MKSFAWISVVVALSFALLAGLLMAVRAQAEPVALARPAIREEPVAPAALRLAPALAVTQAYTVYQPLAAKDYWGYLMYADDFSDLGSGWYVGEIPEVRWGYQSGEYEILISSGPAWAAVTAPLQGIDGYAYEFDVRRQGGPDSLYGSIFGWSDWEHYYVFVVAPDVQYYGVFRRSGEDWVTVVDWDESALIHAGDAANHLRVERSGSQLAIFANGNELASVVDGGYVGELGIGVYAEAGDAVPVVTRYDNVLITRLSSGRIVEVGAAVVMQSEARSGGVTRLLPALDPKRGMDED